MAREDEEFVARALRLVWSDAQVGISGILSSTFIKRLFLGELGAGLGEVWGIVEISQLIE